MEDYKNKLGNLANKLKEEQPRTPIQEVIPVKVKASVPTGDDGEAQLNVWIPKILLRQMKLYGIDHNNMSLKDISIRAIEKLVGKVPKVQDR